MTFAIAKADPALQVVYGWASVARLTTEGIVEDHQGDQITPEDLELAAMFYMLNFRESGVMHEGKSVGRMFASLVTSPDVKHAFGLPDDFPEGWMVGVKYDDADTYRRAAAGELAMFSIQGDADRVDDGVATQSQAQPR